MESWWQWLWIWIWIWIWAGAQLLFWCGGARLVRRRWRPGHRKADRAVTSHRPGKPGPGNAAAAGGAVTFFRPLKTFDAPRLGDLLRFVEQLQPDDEVIFGVEDIETVLTPSLLAVAARDPRVKVIHCRASGLPNRKVSKLVQMTPYAGRDRWVLFDSEAVPGPALLREVRTQLDGATAVMAAYRFGDLDTLPQLADAMGTLTFLLMGDAWSRLAGRPTAVFGACLGLTRHMWEALAGWERFAHDLADDFQIGRALRERGFGLYLCRRPVLLRADALDWPEFWAHQRRAAVTYRVSKPAGFAGAGVVFTLPLLISLGLICGRITWLVVPAVLLMRVAVQMHFNRSLKIEVPPGLVLALSPVLVFTEFTAWLASWFSRRIRWGSQEIEVRSGGVVREIRTRRHPPGLGTAGSAASVRLAAASRRTLASALRVITTRRARAAPPT
ncbi:MAG: glycosyltransferase [Verrucomicrobia bacterium]|nr:glycosyltransferase [Verrucomicrobiota bacterium]